MKAALTCLVTVAACASIGIGTPRAATPKGAALFTAAQASAGAKAYAAHCAACHGAALEGVSAPALRGAASGLAGDSVADAWNFISVQMPAGAPGSLKTSEYVQIVAYILKQNGHAAGATALTAASAKHATKTKV